MTLPLREELPDEVERLNWLVKYVGVQKAYDRKVISALQSASIDAAKAAEKYEGKDNISAKVARYQLSLVRNEIRKIMRDLFKDLVPIVEEGAQEAAEAAAKAALAHDAEVLKLLIPNAKRRKQFEASFKATARQGVKNMVLRVLSPKWPLSERIYKSGRIAEGVLDRKINSAIARGASAKELAKLVKSDVAYGAPGGTSYVAMRLARTEINNAFHAQSIGAAQEQPWIAEMEWHLSKSHEEQSCFCEYYAEEQYFEKGDVPPKPHPQCMCFVTPVSIGKTEFASKLKSGNFDSYFTEKYGMPAA